MAALVFGTEAANEIVRRDKAIRTLELLALEQADFDWWVRVVDMSEEQAAAAAWLHKRRQWNRRTDMLTVADNAWEYRPNEAERERLMAEP
jgi:hypothetical protein